MTDTDQVQGTTESIDERIAKATSTVTEPTKVKETQEAMPTSTKEAEQSVKSDVDVAEAKEETQDASAPEEDLDLPEGVSQRTREQFEKLKERLKQAEAKPKETPPDSTSVFDSFRAPSQPMVDSNALPFLDQQQVAAIQQQFIDDQGNVDIAGVNKALSDANEIARQALIRARQAEDRFTRFEENQQVKEAHSVHPDLDPQSKTFDATLFDMVRDRLLRNMYEGRNQTLLEVANDIKKVYSQKPNLDKVKEDAVTEYKTAQANRDQEPLETGKGAPREETGKLQELRKLTRQGKANALDERLRNLGILK